MGKRGPKATGGYGDKAAVLSTRITAELRRQLEAATAERGMSLSSEIERRLRRSFTDEKTNAEMFGGAENVRLMQTIGVALTARHPDRPKETWKNDPVVFVHVLKTVYQVLWQVRPHGVEQVEISDNDLSAATAEAIWASIHSADATMPLEGVTAKQARANALKADLLDIVDRPTFGLTDYIPPPPPTQSQSLKTTRRAKPSLRRRSK